MYHIYLLAIHTAGIHSVKLFMWASWGKCMRELFYPNPYRAYWTNLCNFKHLIFLSNINIFNSRRGVQNCRLTKICLILRWWHVWCSIATVFRFPYPPFIFYSSNQNQGEILVTLHFIYIHVYIFLYIRSIFFFKFLHFIIKIFRYFKLNIHYSSEL